MAKDPWGKGWMIRIKPASTDLSHMMDVAAYEEHIATPH